MTEVAWSDVAAELPSWVEETDQVRSSGRHRRRGRHGMSSIERLRLENREELIRSSKLRQKLLYPEEVKEAEEEAAKEEAKDIDELSRFMDEEEADLYEMRTHRVWWILCLGLYYGSFLDNTSLRPMRYTEGTIPTDACCETVLEIISIQVTEPQAGLEWPLHVYGHITARDSIDWNRNLLFSRDRDNCQTLTQKDSYLLLTGPVRPIMILDPPFFEVDLKVKGKTEHEEDNVLSSKVFKIREDIFKPTRCLASKRCNLELTFAMLRGAVEATVDSVKVIEGSWPDHLGGKILSRTASMFEKWIVLLDSQDGRMPITYDGKIELSRDVVSVELGGKLFIGVVASQVDGKKDTVKGDTAVFTPLRATKSRCICDLGFCKVEITVAWSLFTLTADIGNHGLPRHLR